MDLGYILAEERIKEAINKGDMENLPGKGKPLELEDLSMIPEDLRSGYIMMKNAGMLPEEMQLKKEMVTLEDLIRSCEDEATKRDYKQKLSQKKIRFHSLMEKRRMSSSGAFGRYGGKINRRLGL
ncbi:DnaJ family domain-containing protein [Salinibacillus xinjiangensis]|uniref:DUF1992 domain-containing protein n=1 Tax=Salinibacillus xinjiangensis TaxID=1229268 RepID=A0A6G1X955_9BACI|nr:DUF1992 domain-containing protein [Salinibacillus xinjiangensis]MRG87435.1 DUF1992 domain-containing protein [Salinibacillus xinjiangensis]